ncbi:division/outer membrane stress-associated lipid-binding lipoprotein [Ferrimonas senticii]|uniref:division/outer membrane stress-associated lipid-binding lipoprotein n=1 Tax=Ferrimonas senticii TaxID=394566 RepID=UPI000423A36B|nr:division/outer membrane stress-associated lipid-binding lipoprotein [Ferrimonas senticii]
MLRLLAALLVLTQLSGCAAAIVAGTVGTAMVVNDNRSVSSQMDDSTIELEVNAQLNKYNDLTNQTRVSVTSINQQLLVVGQVPNQRLHEMALGVIKQVGGITKIHDQLRQGTPLGMMARSHDSWITSNVKSRMLMDSELNSMRIKVVTENNEVFLMGVVSREQADRAVDIARNTAGVTKVVKIFEYL